MPTLEEIKVKQQVVWSSGDYGKIAWVTQPLGDIICEAVNLKPGSKVLDAACGTGHVALAAARRFCEATGVDCVPSLLDLARKRAALEELEVTFKEGDVENLPFPDESFDYVLSTIGAMFAPNQERTAEELLRVCRPEGTVGMVNWKPEGFLGELFRLIASYVTPPEGLKPAALWGSEDRVRELFGERVSSISFSDGALAQNFLSSDHQVEFFLTHYGPTLKAFESLDEKKREAFRQDLADLATRHNRRQDGALTYDNAYLLVIAQKK